MTNRDLLEQLRNNVTTNEWEILTRQADIILPMAEKGAAACMPEESSELKKAKQEWMLPINAFNLQQYMEMKGLDIHDEAVVALDEDKVRGCRQVLENFLEKVFSENRSAWKWIVDSCIYLTFIVKKPMHPMEVLNIQMVEGENGNKTYLCPGKMKGENTCCSYCVCDYLSK